jgi:hypothetical protein
MGPHYRCELDHVDLGALESPVHQRTQVLSFFRSIGMEDGGADPAACGHILHVLHHRPDGPWLCAGLGKQTDVPIQHREHRLDLQQGPGQRSSAAYAPATMQVS